MVYFDAKRHAQVLDISRPVEVAYDSTVSVGTALQLTLLAVEERGKH